MTPELIQAQSFTSAFRGLDPGEVRAFLARVAADVKAWRERADQLESAWRSAEERAARPPVLDEEALIDAVGDETASVLRSARAAASDLRAKAAADAQERLEIARSESERLLAQAKAEADSLIAKAAQDVERMLGEAAARVEQETAESHQSAAALVADAEAQAAALLGNARAEAAAVAAKAQQDVEMTIEAANATRDRILDDLARRRRVASVQIEQLRAGRERLIESYALVRRTLDEVQSELARADAEARAAADEVGRRLRSTSEVPGEEPAEVDADESGVPEPDAVGEPDAVDEPDAVGAPDAVREAGEGAEPDADGAVLRGAELAGAAPADSLEPKASTDRRDSVEPGASEGAGPDRPLSAVDELFARIRANSHDSGDDRSGVQAAVDLRLPSPVADEGRGGSISERQAVADDAPPAADDSADLHGGLTDEEEKLLESREAAIGELEQQLTRALKRSLQDEQNDLLDKLRILSGDLSVERLLGREQAQLRRYRAMVDPALVEAGRRGGDFASQSFGLLDSDGQDGGAVVNVEDLADACAASLVGALRRRLEQAIEAESVLGGEGNPDDRDGLVKAIGSAYREWKSQRIERLVGDALCAAFARGTWTLTPSGEGVRWLVDDLDGACPDCDDDALAGVLAKPEEFPTGQVHPPAHVGCRCMLVPVAVAASRAG